jgi:hypothetical protein
MASHVLSRQIESIETSDGVSVIVGTEGPRLGGGEQAKEPRRASPATADDFTALWFTA